ncbi:uncharacterized protein LOC109863890 isoform X2 [Pseudomyrmex gracilis]|uniref:uncharacterized protein LOC109863890 isoform X2 n=1 Tax=Pseudomyrmex gracilis TaxID=219809 RepID=UPI0009955D3C|nr:uncharacterized protein LOC109863890 isoform X2 [Pseudomyrmex gracilis]
MNICSLWFLLVFIGCIFKKWVISAQSFKRGQNIGTVLFEKNDYQKQCWTNEEFTVLSSRRIFQDILPQMRVIDSENDQYIAHLMDYFYICLESVRRLSVGKTKHLILKALADTLGGYLRVYILPLTKHSYYVGNIKYRNAKMLHDLFDELKVFLRTNGIGWSKPSRDIENVKIIPIVITPPKTSVACNGLITYSAPHERNDSDYRSFEFRKRKGSTVKRRHLRQTVNEYNSEVATRKIIVPLPFLDNEAEPNSIALPFKTDSLQSLYSEKSAFVIVKYYIASVKCIASRSNAHLETFNKDFHNWLQQSVRRRLDDEKWYPAFGGVLRVLATSRELGANKGIAKSKIGGNYQVMPIVERNSQTNGKFYKEKGESDNTMRLGTTEIIIIAIVSALMIWLLVGLSLVCHRFLVRRSTEGCPPCDAKAAPFVVLYENDDYCQPDTCPSKSSPKNVGTKIKDWWRNRFGRCPGGCQEHGDEERCLAAISYSSRDTAVNNNKTYPIVFATVPKDLRLRLPTVLRFKSKNNSQGIINNDPKMIKNVNANNGYMWKDFLF